MAHEGLWEQLEKLDPDKTAQRAKCIYLHDKECYTLQLLNTQYIVDIPERNIYSSHVDSQQSQAAFLEQLCLLAYMINARDLPLANKLVRAETLPGGQFFFRGPHRLPIEKLVKTFGRRPEALLEIAERFNTKQCEFGDVSISLYILPRVPLTIVIWRGCEEFNARASILFDQTADSQLPLDALLVAVNLTVEALINIHSLEA